MINLNVKLKKNLYNMKMMYSASVCSKGRITLDDMADRVALRCTASKSDILAVLAAMQEQAKFALRNGQGVSMGPLGYLYLRCHSKIAQLRENFNASYIKGFVVGFRPKKSFRLRLKYGNGVQFKVNKVESKAPESPQTGE